MLPPKYFFFLLACVCIYAKGYAQNRNANFYFGTYKGINTLDPKILPGIKNNGMASRKEHSCISDEKTGKLLFSCTGGKVLLPDNTLMEGGDLYSASLYKEDVLIVPDPASLMLYYIFYVESANLYYAKVDMNGKGKVVSKQSLVQSQVAASITAVFATHKKSWWLIAHRLNGNEYYSFLIRENGINPNSVVSTVGETISDFNTYSYYITTSHKGDRLIAGMYESSTGGEQTTIELMDIDKKCGTISNSRVLLRSADIFSNPSIIPEVYLAFSPDDSKIYVSIHEKLLQFSGNGYADVATISQDAMFFGGIYTGTDDVTYLCGWGRETSIGAYNTFEIVKIESPDKAFAFCNYQKWISEPLDIITYSIGQPKQVVERDHPGLRDPMDFTFDYACTRFKAEFKIQNDSSYDSIVWHFGDAASGPANVSRVRNASHTFEASGDYVVNLIGYSCGYIDTIKKVLKIRDRLNPQLGNDTTICIDDSLTLTAKVAADAYLWPDGSTGTFYQLFDPGKYWVQVTVGDCKNTDSIYVGKYPAIWTALGEEYYICKDASELVKLDAGEGFQNYKWLPTGDTSQWINVADLGDYFVIVKDFRGCRGNDATKVKRSCPVKMFFPNVFTPNSDGVNDEYVPVGKDVTTFKMTIYNSWGEAVFETNDIGKTWDGTFKGKHCTTGVYLFNVHYEGYFHKQLMSFDTKGNVTLLR
jgi:gliding motility-associated-like protein